MQVSEFSRKKWKETGHYLHLNRHVWLWLNGIITWNDHWKGEDGKGPKNCNLKKAHTYMNTEHDVHFHFYRNESFLKKLVAVDEIISKE